ncbi:MAG: type II toxin-antitoxin system VapB family antitoxin [Desulfobacterales bacterium]
MKTTVHIPDTLLEEARKIANQEQTTIKALIEEGLRLTIESRKQKGKFRLRKATFKGNGLQPDVAGASWEKIRDLSYGARGG